MNGQRKLNEFYFLRGALLDKNQVMAELCFYGADHRAYRG